MVEEINENNFTEKVLKIQGYAVVDFYADWCGPCKMMVPVLNKASNEIKAKFFKINVNNAPHAAMQYKIMSIPAFVIFKDGQEIGKIVGYMSSNAFITKLKSIIS